MQTKPDSLAVITQNMTPGYLRKNGVPYCAKAVLTEHFNVLGGPDGQAYLSVTMLVDDPTFVAASHLATNLFKKIPDGSGWDPTPCWANDANRREGATFVKFGVNTFIWSASFGAAEIALLPTIKERGFDGVEVPLFRAVDFPSAAIRKALETNGLEATACTVLVDGLSRMMRTRRHGERRNNMCVTL